MKKATALFTASSNELKRVSTITVCAMLAAVGVALGTLTIYVTDTIRIGFAGIPVALTGYLFGPVVGGLFAGGLDILKYLVRPMGAFMPLMTLVMVTKGLIYGCFLYRKPLSFGRVFVMQLVEVILCNLLLNTFCLSILYGKAFMALLAPRIVKNLMMWPIDAFVFFNVAKALELTGVFRILGKGRAVS